MPYFRIASFILLITSASHLAGHFFMLPHFQLTSNITGKMPENSTEKEMLTLMNQYHRKVGGSEMSMMDIQNGLSLTYGLFFLWMGALNLLLYKPIRRNHRLLARISYLNTVMLGIGVAIAVVYFFWLPIASFALAMIFFAIAGYIFSKSRQF
jgi:uncharacterized membrane protein